MVRFKYCTPDVAPAFQYMVCSSLYVCSSVYVCACGSPIVHVCASVCMCAVYTHTCACISVEGRFSVHTGVFVGMCFSYIPVFCVVQCVCVCCAVCVCVLQCVCVVQSVRAQ